ncbi:uncharacterized protein N7479_001456 [Penicillium vulpinum]|uniref:uncharacterized protein n=1 Tax=Penicillium vulpinum TaxID=29845 RepID=UPI002546A790|nr:uncharacterized protein N7479_001456 [Penicillium vulpinum]KAJ5971538.1 hypothetical protein N7479_001456 [Penicillium vulpinum]
MAKVDIEPRLILRRSKLSCLIYLAILERNICSHGYRVSPPYAILDQNSTLSYPFTWAWCPLSLDEFCIRDPEDQEIPYPHLQIAIFSFDCPGDSSILASKLSVLVQMIGIRSRQPTFSGTPSIAALLISIFGARQVRVIQAFYSKGKCKKGGKEGDPELTVKLGKTMDLASKNENENEERKDAIIRWMTCSLSFLQTEKT